MFLKRVRLCGFKSFCDRVDFEFGPGITCIVGPNGCGKSNVVDAFKWVLGEQSARSLRGRQMIDMIFNGSGTRRASSVAQVDLVFDNSDRTLPLDFEEVTVTRKLYRSGESEYLLNNASTRLKDVRELFMDTGVGVDAYSIIEQGRVDVLLQSNPIERRTIFEEAAGISKYKTRRREAQRKLERTEQNLLRVQDIIEELEKRLRSVKLQAAKARRYKEYEDRLNELRSSYALAEYHRFAGEIDRLSREEQERADQITSLRTEIDRHEAEGTRVTLRLDELAEEIGNADNQLVQAKSDLAAQEERIQAARRRVEEQRASLERAQHRSSGDTRRLEASSAELVELQDSAQALQSMSHQLGARVNELKEQDRSLGLDLTETQALLEDEKAGIIELLRRSAQKHNEIIRLNTHRESLVGEKGRLSTRDAQVSAELEANLERKAQLDRRLAEVETLIETETQTLEQKKIEATRVGDIRQRLADQLVQAREQRSALLSRRELLADLERNMEGVDASVRKVLDQKRQSTDPQAFEWAIGILADVFEVGVAHASMIDAALGGWGRYLVVADSASLLGYVAAAGDLSGRFTSLCLDRLEPVVNERDFSGQPGFVARALDLVQFPQRFEHLARQVLGKTIVVEDVESAMAMAALDASRHRFVTREGEVLEPDGRFSFGPPSSNSGLVSRKSELRNIEVQLATIEESFELLRDQLDRTQAQEAHLDNVQQELRTAIHELSTVKAEANATLQSIAETIARLSNEKPIIAQEVTLIEQQINEVLEKSEAGGRTLEALERENQEREGQVEVRRNRIDEIVALRRNVQEQLTQARVEVGQVTEKSAAIADRIHALKRGINELQESVTAANSDVEQCRTNINDAEQTITTGGEQLAVLNHRAEGLEATASRLRGERDTLRLDMDGRAHAIKSVRGRLAEVEAALHQSQMALAETKVRRDELVARVSAEMGIDLAERYGQYEHQEQDWEQVEAEITELRSKMHRLGNVNLDAITELQELQERHEFLTGQHDDLTKSRRQLEQLIDRLDQESRTRFRTAFEQIRDHFRGMFRKLFGGGRADIVLEDPDNILECGIEIVAQPPGKDLQVISLMSGGEKSLTAIALLMSIFQTRPAPFAILDEVDAALDEANNVRFNSIVKEFVSESQFIIITHSRWTMNTADRLYGITMHEPGISTRVGVEFTGANVA